MENELQIIDASIALVANNNNPTILNPDFLKYNAIIPSDWELSTSPIVTEPFAQVSFKNAFQITSQFQKIVFSCNDFSEIDLETIASTAKRYIETIYNVKYVALGFNPTFFSFRKN